MGRTEEDQDSGERQKAVPAHVREGSWGQLLLDGGSWSGSERPFQTHPHKQPAPGPRPLPCTRRVHTWARSGPTPAGFPGWQPRAWWGQQNETCDKAAQALEGNKEAFGAVTSGSRIHGKEISKSPQVSKWTGGGDWGGPAGMEDAERGLWIYWPRCPLTFGFL